MCLRVPAATLIVSKNGDGMEELQEIKGFSAAIGGPSAAQPPARAQRPPLLMIDIDGVISLFGAGQGSAAAGLRDAPEGSLHAIDGMIHFLSATAASHLLALAGLFELVWASGWEEGADEHLPRLLGLPRGLPHLRFERAVGRSHAHWKLAAIERYARARPLAWLDDSFNDACRAWAQARAAPTLLVATDPAAGLTAREASLLRRFALEDALGTPPASPPPA